MIRLKRFVAGIYWQIFRPKTLGVRILIINKNKVLLVRHTYIPGWYIPGGGVEGSESFGKAIKREVLEEIGVEINNPELFGVYQNKKEGRRDTVVVFVSRQIIQEDLEPKDNELSEVKLFNIKKLPVDISPGSKRRIDEYLSNDFPKVGSW